MGCAEEKVTAKLKRKKDIPAFCCSWRKKLGETGLLSFYDENFDLESEFSKRQGKYIFEIEDYPLFRQWAGGDQIKSFVTELIEDHPEIELDLEYVATDDSSSDAILDVYKYCDGILSMRRAYSEYGLGDYCEECDSDFDKYLIKIDPTPKTKYKCPVCGEIIEYSAQIEQIELKFVDGKWQKNEQPKVQVEESSKQTAKEPTKPKKEWQTNKMPDGTLRLKSYNGIEKKIVLPSEIGKAKVSVVGMLALSPDNIKKSDERYLTRNSIEEIVVSEGITTIETGAFKGCSELRKVTLPKSLISIESDAFRECKKLEIVCFNGENNTDGSDAEETDGLKSIGGSAFWGCDALKEIKIPNTVKTIGNYAFYCCSKLTNIVLPEALEELGSFAFYGTAYTDFIWPENVKIVAAKVYHGTGIKSFNIPAGVEQIDSYAFHYWRDLEEIQIPESVTKIGSYAFSACEQLKEILIPSSINTIDEGTFSQCKALEKIYIPSSVNSIFDVDQDPRKQQMLPFWNCEKLTIYTPAGSVAEQYAKDHGISVVTDEK